MTDNFTAFFVGVILGTALGVLIFSSVTSEIGSMVCESIGETYKTYSTDDRTFTCSETIIEFPKQSKTKTFCLNCTEEKE